MLDSDGRQGRHRGCANVSRILLGLWLGASGSLTPALAHVEYYDLNQGAQIGDLTVAGKTQSTAQYGANPSVTGPGVTLNTTSGRPLNDPAYWNGTYQSYTGVGTFSNVHYDADLSSATVDVDDVTDWGWGDGTHSLATGPIGTLGDTHKVDFFNFRLAKASLVTITWNVDDSTGNYIDNGFSVFRGVMNYQTHDDSSERLNPTTFGVGKVQSALDTGTVRDAQGIASAYRNTTASGPGNYIGQFNALDNWGCGNQAGNWSAVSFVAAANSHNPADGFSNNPNDTLESLTIKLAPGNYIIAASGALGAQGYGTNPGTFNLSNLHGHLTFQATAIEACQ